MNEQEYLEIAKKIWNEEIPKDGQSLTVQGEMIRSIEKLRDEAQRNGNGNRDDGHKIMLAYLGEHLLNYEQFTGEQKGKINSIIIELSDSDTVVVDDSHYDYLTNRVVDWISENKSKNNRVVNPVLKR